MTGQHKAWASLQRFLRGGAAAFSLACTLWIAAGCGTTGSHAPAGAPLPPADLTAVGGVGEITLTWSASKGATSYLVCGSASPSGPFSLIATTAATDYVVVGLPAGSTQYFEVVAEGPGGRGAPSTAVGASALPHLSAPAQVIAIGGSAQIFLAWTSVDGATAYIVLRSYASGGPYQAVESSSTTQIIDSGLPAGTTYFYVVQALGPSVSSLNSTEVGAITIPAPPSAVVASGGNGQATIGWNLSAGATGYVILRAENPSGPYVEVGSTAGTSFVDSGLVPGRTYYYAVEAANESGASAAQGLAGTAPATTAPPAPGNVVSIGGGGSVTIRWSAASASTGYAVLRATSSGGPYVVIGTTSGTSLVDAGGLASGTPYFYVVVAGNVAGLSNPSSETSALTTPAAPTGVSATGGTGQVSLSWSAPVGASAFIAFRGASTGGPYSPIATTATTSFVDTGRPAGTESFYVVQAVDASGTSGFSLEVAAVTIPAPPTGLSGTGATGEVFLSWTASAGATGYAVSRSMSLGGPYAFLGSSMGSAYTDTSVTSGATYYYVVQAGDFSGTSADSLPASALTIPAAPTGLNLGGGAGTVQVSWTVSTGATGYAVLRSTVTGGPYVPIAFPAGTTYSDGSVNGNTAYYYVVRAADSSGTSGNSSEAEITTGLGAPTAVTGTGGVARVTLSWSSSAGATGYAIFRSLNSGGPYSPVGTTGSITFVNLGLSSGTTYYYVVQAANASNTSAYSGEAGAITIPASPTGFGASLNAGVIGLSWNASTGATGYAVLRATVTGGPYAPAGFPSGTTFTDTSIVFNLTYFYVLVAADPSGMSAYSSEVSVATGLPWPTGLLAAGGIGQASLSWNAAMGATGYALWSGTSSGGPYTYAGSTTGTSFTMIGLAAGTTYYFVVQSASSAGTSVNSMEANALTATSGGVPAAPAAITAVVSGVVTASISWSLSTGATAYAVYRSTAVAGPYVRIATTTGTSYTDSSLAGDTTYYFFVLADNASGWSGSTVERAITTPWAKTYGGSGDDLGYQVEETPDGGAIVAGSTYSFTAGNSDAWVLKLDPSGVPLWQRAYGGTDVDAFFAIDQTSDGGYAGAGYTYSYGLGGGDVWVVKLNPDGTIGWQESLGGGLLDEARSICQTNDGGFLVVGYTDSFGAGSDDVWVIKLNANGSVAWQKALGGIGSDIGFSGQQTTDGGYIVAGDTASFGAGGTDAWILKLNTNGTIAWQRTYGGGSNDYAFSVRQTLDGGYIAAGTTSSFGAGSYDLWVLKLNSDGTVAWQKTYGGSGDDEASSITQTVDGGYIVSGYTSSFGAGSADYWLLKLNSNGSVAWQRAYGGTNIDHAASVVPWSDGGFMATGFTTSFGAGIHDFWTLKVATDGSVAFSGGSGATGTITAVSGVSSAAATTASTATVTGTAASPTATPAGTISSSATIVQQAP